jgi:hypothetical protein
VDFVAAASFQSGMLLKGIGFEYLGNGAIRYDRPSHEREQT